MKGARRKLRASKLPYYIRSEVLPDTGGRVARGVYAARDIEADEPLPGLTFATGDVVPKTTYGSHVALVRGEDGREFAVDQAGIKDWRGAWAGLINTFDKGHRQDVNVKIPMGKRAGSPTIATKAIKKDQQLITSYGALTGRIRDEPSRPYTARATEATP